MFVCLFKNFIYTPFNLNTGSTQESGYISLDSSYFYYSRRNWGIDRNYGNINIDNYTNKEIGDGSKYNPVIEFYYNKGVNSGTYSLQSLLQKLVDNSHTHSFKQGRYTINCNCDCD